MNVECPISLLFLASPFNVCNAGICTWFVIVFTRCWHRSLEASSWLLVAVACLHCKCESLESPYRLTGWWYVKLASSKSTHESPPKNEHSGCLCLGHRHRHLYRMTCKLWVDVQNLGLLGCVPKRYSSIASSFPLRKLSLQRGWEVRPAPEPESVLGGLVPVAVYLWVVKGLKFWTRKFKGRTLKRPDSNFIQFLAKIFKDLVGHH